MVCDEHHRIQNILRLHDKSANGKEEEVRDAAGGWKSITVGMNEKKRFEARGKSITAQQSTYFACCARSDESALRMKAEAYSE